MAWMTDNTMLLRQAFLDISKKTQGQKNLSKFSKNSSKSFKNSIICQLKTDFFLQKVPKLVYFAQKFAQTSVFLLNKAQNWENSRNFGKKFHSFE